MIWTNREAQFPGKKRIIKVDEDNVPLPGEAPILVNIEKDEGTIHVNGTPISSENLNKGNWRDDDSISFGKRNDSNLPNPKANETQIITLADGETWIVPPLSLGVAKKVSNSDWSGIAGKPASFTPSVHASSHGSGGSDPLALPTSQISGLDNALSLKLEKVSSQQSAGNAQIRIYAVAPNGTQQMCEGSADALTNAIAFRSSDGNLVIPSPQNNNSNYAVSKGYVDSKTVNGGVRRSGGSVALSVADADRGKTIVFTSNVTALTITGSSAQEDDEGYDDTETRYIFKTGSSAITPTKTNIDYQFPSAFSPLANKKYMVAIFGRILTWCEGA